MNLREKLSDNLINMYNDFVQVVNENKIQITKLTVTKGTSSYKNKETLDITFETEFGLTRKKAKKTFDKLVFKYPEISIHFNLRETTILEDVFIKTAECFLLTDTDGIKLTKI